MAPNTINTKPFLTVTNDNIDDVYGKFKDTLDSFYVNTWYSEDAIDALFQ